MPELPEVETTRRGLEAHLVGQRVQTVELRRQDLRFPIPKNFIKTVSGRDIVAVRRRAKYLLIDLSGGVSILAHLGMSGSFVVAPKRGYALKTHDHALFYLKNGHVCVFNDPRRFGVLDILETSAESSHCLLKNLGPEPFSEDFSESYLRAQLKRRNGAIKPVLMDQKLVVGVGNIYASEALHMCGINPSISAKKTASLASDIIPAIRAVLQAAINSGGSTLRNYVGASNQAGYFQHQFRVYDRANESCFLCGEKIQSMVQAGRATYWCDVCQPMLKKPQKR